MLGKWQERSYMGETQRTYVKMLEWILNGLSGE